MFYNGNTKCNKNPTLQNNTQEVSSTIAPVLDHRIIE